MFYGKNNPQLGQFGLVVAKARAKQSPEELCCCSMNPRTDSIWIPRLP